MLCAPMHWIVKTNGESPIKHAHNHYAFEVIKSETMWVVQLGSSHRATRVIQNRNVVSLEVLRDT